MSKGKVIALVIAGLVVLGLVGSAFDSEPEPTKSDQPAQVEEPVEERPGNPDVYADIAAMTNCAELQEAFDTAMDNVERYPGGDPRREVPMSYADAADARMREVGCYG